MTVIGVGILGLLTGLHAATWGAYKDTRFEGFRRLSFVRSIIVGVVVAVLVVVLSSAEHDYEPIVLVGLLYTLERLATEWWKTILRDDDQDAYTIPMRLAVLGRPVDGQLKRYGAGVAIVVGLVLVSWAVITWQSGLDGVPRWADILIGGLGGWLTAAGGAWKDAPVEGFSGRKFFRSPVVATAWAVPLSVFVENWVILAFVAGGFSVATIETYKTFLTGNRPPGKWATKPARFADRSVRTACATLFAGLWLSLSLLLVVQLSSPRHAVRHFNSSRTLLEATMVVLIVATAVLGVLVVVGHVRGSRAGTSAGSPEWVAQRT